MNNEQVAEINKIGGESMKPNKSEQQIRKEVLEEVKIYFEGLHIYINKVLAEINKLEEKTK